MVAVVAIAEIDHNLALRVNFFYDQMPVPTCKEYLYWLLISAQR